MIPRAFFHKPIYKYFDKIEYAESFLKKGTIRIGTLESYRAIEKYGDDIGDSREGVIDELYIKNYDPETLTEKPPHIPFVYLGGKVEELVMEGNTVNGKPLSSRDYFIYCTTEICHPDLFHRLNAAAYVEILRPNAFFDQIAQLLRPLFDHWNVQRCTYQKKTGRF